jgi:hypothetical protein
MRFSGGGFVIVAHTGFPASMRRSDAFNSWHSAHGKQYQSTQHSSHAFHW